ALAAATLKALTRRHAVTLATTHLGALKKLGAETVGIVNASLQFDAETLTPTYRLLKGVPGRSYGLAIARQLGVPADVLREAERSDCRTEDVQGCGQGPDGHECRGNGSRDSG